MHIGIGFPEVDKMLRPLSNLTHISTKPRPILRKDQNRDIHDMLLKLLLVVFLIQEITEVSDQTLREFLHPH